MNARHAALAGAVGAIAAVAWTGPQVGGVAFGHRSGCHAAHTCPSDHHTYVWYSHRIGYSCAAAGATERSPTLDTKRVRYMGRSYFCRLARMSSGSWTIENIGASIPEAPFHLRLFGRNVGAVKTVAIAHRLEATGRVPQVMVLAASGYVRLKPGADPVPPLPFGQSIVLGPAVFGTTPSRPQQTRLFFHPQLQRVSIGHTSGKGLRLNILAARNPPEGGTPTNQIAKLRWSLQLDEPSRVKTKLEVDGTYRFTENVVPDPVRVAELQAFRLLQVSSMYIDAQRHDVDAFRFRSNNGMVRVSLNPNKVDTLLPAVPTPLSARRPTLDVLHTDNFGLPNGDTPSYRIMIRAVSGPASGPITPRSYFNASQDVNDDNLGIWLYQQPPAVFRRGEHGSIEYTVTATANPQRWR